MPQPGIRAPKTSLPSVLDILGNPRQLVVTIDSTTRDGGRDGGAAAATSTKLQPGLVLGKLTAANRYTDYDTNGSDGSQNEEDCVILLDFVDVEDGHRDAAVAVSGGVFDRSQLRWNLAADKAGFEWSKTVLDAR